MNEREGALSGMNSADNAACGPKKPRPRNREGEGHRVTTKGHE